MSGSFFLETVTGATGASFSPTDHVCGPWSSAHMHAGPPSALIAHVIARVGAVSVVPDPGLMARITIEILAPVPVRPVEVSAQVVRSGRRIALVEAELTPEGSDEPVMTARAWILRTVDVAVPGGPEQPPPPPGTETAEIPPGWGRGYLDAIRWWWVDGSFERPGPATVWCAPRYPLVAGHALQPVERVLLVADSGNGISAVANPRDLLFVNPELTVHLRRAPEGERVWMRSSSALERNGVGLASTVLGDQTGAIGSGAQSLFVAVGPGS